MKFTTQTTILALVSLVSAHGFVKSISVDGKASTGNVPLAKADPSPIRQITDFFPIKGAASAALTCGTGAVAASEVVNALPGSEVSFEWSGGNVGSKWPHNVGPMLTYLANCGSTTCDKFDASTAKWFKIDQVGRSAPGADWVQADTLFVGKPASVTLPKTLAAGNYLIRHEVIALHNANTEGQAEFYPSCSQLKVGGTQTGVPSPDELVSLPGAYKDTDAGIFVPDIFNSKTATYTFPGPAIAKIAAVDAAAPSNSGTTSASGPKPTNSGKHCTVKAKAKRSTRPHVRSRVMRDLPN